MNINDIEKMLAGDGENRAQKLSKDKIISNALAQSQQPKPAQGGKVPSSGAPSGGQIAAATVKQKKPYLIIIIALALVAVIAIGLGIGLPFMLGGGGGGRVPVYLGMQVSGIAQSVSASSTAIDDTTDGDREISQEHPFGGDTTILDEIQDGLSIVTSDRVEYYADQGDDILITVKLSNPDNYVILSFTLNGEYYANYMFEQGSNMENLILKTNVGNAAGIVEYTIDAIKYVDGEAIKDVVLGGEKTIKVGVRSHNQTTASVTNEVVGLDRIGFNVDLSDKYDLIEKSNGYAKAVLFDGEEIIAEKDLALGDNNVSFGGLKSNTVYQYAVYAYYDNLDGQTGGASLNLLHTKAVSTRPTVLFDSKSIMVGQEGISFDFAWDSAASGSIDSIDLYLDGELVRTISANRARASQMTIADLLSGKEYTMVAHYKNINGENETITMSFTTQPKTAPKVAIKDITTTQDAIKFALNITDTDSVGGITSITLYKGDTKVTEITDFGYNSDTDYKRVLINTQNSRNLHETVETITDSKDHPGHTEKASLCKYCGNGTISICDADGKEAGYTNISVYDSYKYTRKYWYYNNGRSYEILDRTDYTDGSWYQTAYSYNFDGVCQRTSIYTSSYGEYSTGTGSACKTSYYGGTCTQVGGYICNVCHNTESSSWPNGHNWVHYKEGTGKEGWYCASCYLESAVGAVGIIDFEDLGDRYNDDSNYYIGFFNRAGYKYDYVVSIVLHDENNTNVITTVMAEHFTDTIVTINKQAVADWAKTNGYEGKSYDIRLTFVPQDYNDDCDYAITLTE